MPRQVIVCGGRNYARKSVVKRVLACEIQPGDVIVHGGASGADSLADQWAHMHGHDVIEYRAAWTLHGAAAGPIRNQKMLDESRPDLVIAFPGGKDTADMVRRAERAGITVVHVSKYADGEEEGDA